MIVRGHNLQLKKRFFKFLYYNFAIYLPHKTSRPFGKLSRSIRTSICRHIFEYCGKNVNIEHGAQFGNGFKIKIGDNSGLGIDCVIPEGSIIGNNVMMGPNCYVHSHNHNFSRTDIPMIQQGLGENKILVVDDDVWIGRDVAILPGRHIATGTIIASNSVVTKDFPPYSIIGGNPAKLIRSRLDAQ